ncbi:MAG: ASPIC/UnbV domain-containing protein [Planctomycetota bacterium]
MSVGAVVTVRAGDLVQRCMVRTGSSYLSQSDTALVCGLGRHREVDGIEIRWPSGKVDTLGPAAADKTYVLAENDPRLVHHAR